MIVDLNQLGNIDFNANRFFNPQIRDEFVKNFAASIPSGLKVLDVASGNRPYKNFFEHCDYKSHEFQGNEQITDSFRGENEKPIHDFYGDITELPIPDQTFDVVICTEVLEHVPEPIQAIKELVRVTKTGGTILITCPMTSGEHQLFHFYAGFSKGFYKYISEKFNLTMNSFSSQGDIFKVCFQLLNNCLYYIIPGTNPEVLTNTRYYIEQYLLSLSKYYGDESENPIECSKQFTVGFCVIYTKN